MDTTFETALNDFLAACQEKASNSYAHDGFTLNPPIIKLERGHRYVRIVKTDASAHDRSAFGFIDTTNGDVLKAAGWKAPAKNFARGNVYDDKHGVGRIHWTGVF